jgi:hypothetical protein
MTIAEITRRMVQENKLSRLKLREGNGNLFSNKKNKKRKNKKSM